MYGIINKTNVQNVKNTMFDKLLSILAPHLCYKCGKTGHLLCDNCKYDITSEEFVICILCRGPADSSGVCSNCDAHFSRAWCVGDRTEELHQLLNDYKFMRVYAAHVLFGELLAQKIGQLPEGVVIVPIPTNASHVRQRGYDHTLLMARQLAKLSRTPVRRILRRHAKTVQTGKTKRERFDQAARTFVISGDCEGKTVLIIDDIVTTGATLQAAARLCRDAGAVDVWVAAVARQPLD